MIGYECGLPLHVICYNLRCKHTLCWCSRSDPFNASPTTAVDTAKPPRGAILISLTQLCTHTTNRRGAGEGIWSGSGRIAECSHIHAIHIKEVCIAAATVIRSACSEGVGGATSKHAGIHKAGENRQGTGSRGRRVATRHHTQP